MKKLLVVAVFAVVLTALVGSSIVVGDSGNSAGIADRSSTFVWAPLMLGGSKSETGTLSAGLPTDFDVTFILPVGSGTLNVEIEDCCILGDTMAGIFIQQGGVVDVQTATSPATIVKNISVSGWTWVLLITGYLDAPGGYPAGYYLDASFS